jgi:hypothetical protein
VDEDEERAAAWAFCLAVALTVLMGSFIGSFSAVLVALWGRP